MRLKRHILGATFYLDVFLLERIYLSNFITLLSLFFAHYSLWYSANPVYCESLSCPTKPLKLLDRSIKFLYALLLNLRGKNTKIYESVLYEQYYIRRA